MIWLSHQESIGKFVGKMIHGQRLHGKLNLLSISEYYGKEVQKVALSLLNKNLIDFVGSDVHTIKQLKALKEITIADVVYEKLMPVVQNTITAFYQ